MGITSTAYRIVLVLHILVVIVGIGTVFLNGLYGAEAKKRPGPGGLAISQANYRVSMVAEYFIYAIIILGFALVGRDLVREVMPKEVREWDEPLDEWARPLPQPLEGGAFPPPPAFATGSKHVVALDYGMKWNIPRHLKEMGCRVTVVPGTSTAADILALKPDGVFLSNGPGDPRPLTYAVDPMAATVSETWAYSGNHQYFAAVMGNVDVRPDDTRVIGWGTAGVLNDVTADGMILWQLEGSLGGGFGYVHRIDGLKLVGG